MLWRNEGWSKQMACNDRHTKEQKNPLTENVANWSYGKFRKIEWVEVHRKSGKNAGAKTPVGGWLGLISDEGRGKLR
jgi:hypothetical protein